MQSFASTQLADEIFMSHISQVEANARELSVFTTIVATVIALHALQSPMHYTMSLALGHVVRRIIMYWIRNTCTTV